ncbi:hypothetical protein HOK021_31870 [Streptomyces hygroscopicus]|nr:hypothetical protein HOK021_31870 [Streptomyces hygroscopicus]
MRNRIPMGSGCVKGSPELPDRRIPRDGSVIGAPGVPVAACRPDEGGCPGTPGVRLPRPRAVAAAGIRLLTWWQAGKWRRRWSGEMWLRGCVQGRNESFTKSRSVPLDGADPAFPLCLSSRNQSCSAQH